MVEEMESAEQHIDCGEVMDISTMAEFHRQLVAVLASKQAMALDASQVERADSSALQVLSAFIQDAHAQQQAVRWKAPSDALCRSAALLGLTGILNLEKNPLAQHKGTQ